VYGSKQQLPVIGKFEATIETKKQMTASTIDAVRDNYGSLLSYQTATELNLIKVCVCYPESVTHVPWLMILYML
jgi:mevalonate kinase